jgi:hypothetical protein
MICLARIEELVLLYEFNYTKGSCDQNNFIWFFCLRFSLKVVFTNTQYYLSPIFGLLRILISLSAEAEIPSQRHIDFPSVSSKSQK